MVDTLTTSVAVFTNTYHNRSSGGGGGSSGGGPKVSPQPNPTDPAKTEVPAADTPKAREEMTPQELYDIYGEVPLGYMVGPNNDVYTPQQLYEIWGQVPLGYMLGSDGQLHPGGLPKTGDHTPVNLIALWLFIISALSGMAAIGINVNKKKN